MAMKGKDKHLQRLKRMRGIELTKRVGAALFSGADMIKAEAQRSITAGSVSGMGHVPSLPGEPPNNDTGVLKDNIEAARTGPMVAIVGSYAPYSAPLEFGTSRMAARPFMIPARDKKRDEVAKMVADAVEQAVKAAGR